MKFAHTYLLTRLFFDDFFDAGLASRRNVFFAEPALVHLRRDAHDAQSREATAALKGYNDTRLFPDQSNQKPVNHKTQKLNKFTFEECALRHRRRSSFGNKAREFVIERLLVDLTQMK
jgi:hypothetical protein